MEALKKLGIEEHAYAIFNSNSHGELLHIEQYILLANLADEHDMSWFAEWFNCIVDYAKKHWKRPQSVYQHVIKILNEQVEFEGSIIKH